MPNGSRNVHEAAERAARTAYGKLVAVLAVRARDIHAAEDALSEAFAEALLTWPRDGIPESPEAWLITAARNNLTDAQRRNARSRTTVMNESDPIRSLLWSVDPLNNTDERLTMLFVCAHPAIDQSVRTPLMLQAVMGLSAEQIAAAFITSPSTMSQRLVRAKRKIADSAVRFDRPDNDELPERLSDVLEAIYGVFAVAYDQFDGADGPGTSLASEALDLVAIVTHQLPAHAEVWGLRALMLLCHARRDARRDALGRFVPLHEQDTHLWDSSLIEAGNQALEQAANLRRPGRYQTEAAIQSIHIDAKIRGVDLSIQLARMHDVLASQAPTIGNLIARAAAWSNANHAREALRLLDAIAQSSVESHQPYWAVRAAVLRSLGEHADSAACYQRAAGLTTDQAVRRWLLDQIVING